MNFHLSAAHGFAASILMAALAAAPTPARSAQLVSGADVEEILNLAKGFGSASLTTDDEGDPKIDGRMDGLAYSIYFLGCEEHKNCTSVQLHSGFELKDKPSATKIVQWNYDKRWARAFLNKGGAAIQMDINLRYGVARETFDDSLRTWGRMMKQYSEYVGYSK